MVVVANKSSIQLEGCPISTEISDLVYEDLVQSNSKYLNIDPVSQNIIVKKSFFKKNKQIHNATRFYVELNGSEIQIETPSVKNDCFSNSAYSDHLIEANYKNKTIAIILESPHIDEYESNVDKLTPVGPAQGQIGRKIEKNIGKLVEYLDHFKVLEENHRYRVIILNAVNFQTSLHFIHEKPLNNHYRELRDKIWVKMWNELPHIRTEFIKQIESLKRHSILINACPKSLKPFIYQECIPYSQKYVLFESNHPSSTETWTNSLFKLN